MARVADVRPDIGSLGRVFLTVLDPAPVVWLAIGLFFTFSISRPLVRIRRATVRMAQGDYDVRVPAQGEGEIALLASRFNEMAERVQSGNRVLRDFVANVSHDLRTPLTMISGFSQALLDGTAGPSEVTTSAEYIYEESLKMQRLVEDLLQLTRLESGLQPQERHPLELRPLVQSLMDHIARSRGDRDTPMIRNDVSESTPTIEVDEGQLERALRNLIENALRYTPVGGSVRVSAEPIGVGWVEISVQDTGAGIPPQVWVGSSNGFIARTRAGNGAEATRAWDWPSCAKSWKDTAVTSRWKATSERERPSASRFRKSVQPHVYGLKLEPTAHSLSRLACEDFDRVADVYDATREMPSFVYDRIVERVVAATRATAETRFLEIGVGTGRIAVPFLERGYRYTGVDISERMMDRLRAKVRTKDVALTLVNGDVTQLPFEDASFDVVLAVHILHLVSDWQRAIREARRVLAPAGYLVLGYESSQSDSPGNELRRQWQTFVAEAGVSLSSRSGRWPGTEAALIEGGSYAAVYRVAHWVATLVPRTVLDEQRGRVFSHSWDVPEDVLEAVHQRMVGSAADRPARWTPSYVRRESFCFRCTRSPLRRREGRHRFGYVASRVLFFVQKGRRGRSPGKNDLPPRGITSRALSRGA